MKQEVKVGLIGLGTIGKGLARAIASGAAGKTHLTAVLTRPAGYNAARDFLHETGLDAHVTCDPAEFFAADTNLIVEAAGQTAAREYGAQVLATGRDLLVCATGVFTDDSLYENWTKLAEDNGCRLIIPSGAIAGIDALTSAAIAGVEYVCITTRKPPAAWYGTPAETMLNLAEITDVPALIFEGTAREAARLFPQNINVAATLACAGIGMDNTRARVYADPTISRNVHQIHVRSACVELQIEVCGKPSTDNPRSSALTAYSIIKTVRSLSSPILIG
jgi:aspartate dehydrogenase